jgi:hypothetical protein
MPAFRIDDSYEHAHETSAASAMRYLSPQLIVRL